LRWAVCSKIIWNDVKCLGLPEDNFLQTSLINSRQRILFGIDPTDLILYKFLGFLMGPHSQVPWLLQTTINDSHPSVAVTTFSSHFTHIILPTYSETTELEKSKYKVIHAAFLMLSGQALNSLMLEAVLITAKCLMLMLTGFRCCTTEIQTTDFFMNGFYT
jgi:hypothetical protein